MSFNPVTPSNCCKNNRSNDVLKDMLVFRDHPNQWARSSFAKRPANQSAKKTYLAELLSTDLSRRWDKTFVLAGSLYPQVTEL